VTATITEVSIMKVCITTATTEPEAKLDARFARCRYFTFIDTETGELEIEENPFTGGANGVGTRVGQYLAERGTEAVITSQVGPSAFTVLQAAGITAYASGAATIHEALADFRSGLLERIAEPSGAKHARPQ
jgi:predicted Fe-Mo cluster-binding NifX family protein